MLYSHLYQARKYQEAKSSNSTAHLQSPPRFHCDQHACGVEGHQNLQYGTEKTLHSWAQVVKRIGFSVDDVQLLDTKDVRF